MLRGSICATASIDLWVSQLKRCLRQDVVSIAKAEDAHLMQALSHSLLFADYCIRSEEVEHSLVLRSVSNISIRFHDRTKNWSCVGV